MLPTRNGISAEAINIMVNVYWVAYDPSEVVCGANDAVVVRRVVLLQHTKVWFQPDYSRS